MDNLLTVIFEAHHAELNHHLRYEIRVGTDLFHQWTVSICYGRTGQGGRVEQFAGDDADELRAIIRDRLRRRLSAPRRIGCAYQLTTMDKVFGFDAGLSLPGDVMTRLKQ
jgi:hypothetical protein